MKHRLPGGRLHGHPGTQLQHGGRQLRFRLRPGGHEGAHGEGVGLTELSKSHSPNLQIFVTGIFLAYIYF